MIRGGTIIGEGGLGCIFSPTVYSHESDKVSKIVSFEEAKNEESISQQLSRIDRSAQFGIYVIGRKNCNISFSDLYKEGLGKGTPPKCPRLLKSAKATASLGSTKADGLCELIYPKYVHDLEQYPNLTRAEIANGFLNLWAGLILYHSHGIVHADIKAPNIALQNGTFKFADWGWSANINGNKAAGKLYRSILEHPDYTPREFGGSGGPWAPCLFSEEEVISKSEASMAQAVLYNDSFSLTYFMYDFLLQFHEDSKDLIEACQKVMNDQNWRTTEAEIVSYLEPFIMGFVTEKQTLRRPLRTITNIKKKSMAKSMQIEDDWRF